MIKEEPREEMTFKKSTERRKELLIVDEEEKAGESTQRGQQRETICICKSLLKSCKKSDGRQERGRSKRKRHLLICVVPYNRRARFP